jgi:hypothetical protein
MPVRNTTGEWREEHFLIGDKVNNFACGIEQDPAPATIFQLLLDLLPHARVQLRIDVSGKLPDGGLASYDSMHEHRGHVGHHHH